MRWSNFCTGARIEYGFTPISARMRRVLLDRCHLGSTVRCSERVHGGDVTFGSGATSLKISDILETEPLSKALQRARIFAQERGARDLTSWLQLELDGYYDSNDAMNDSITVPKYRTVVGAHYNDFGQRLQLKSDLAFVNEIRLREGVEALESLKDTRQTVVLQDMQTNELIAQHLEVQVSTFHLDKAQIIGVLSQIRSELFRRVQFLAGSTPSGRNNEGTKDQEIVMLSPNFYGVGVNLRALWHRVKPSKRTGGL
jgi:AbiTii